MRLILRVKLLEKGFIKRKLLVVAYHKLDERVYQSCIATDSTQNNIDGLNAVLSFDDLKILKQLKGELPANVIQINGG